MFKLNTLTTLLLWMCLTCTTHAESLPNDLTWVTNNDAPIWADLSAEKGGVFSNFMLSFPPTLRTVGPDSNNSFRSYINANQLGLTDFHPDSMAIIPQIATSWAYGKDGKTVYYKLNSNARWSDGEKVTADDFLFTLTFMRSKHIQAPWYNNHYSTQITSIKKYDDHSISITGAVARSKDELHYYYGLTPTPKHFYKKLDEGFIKKHNWKIVPNTGPYQIAKIKKGKQIEFLRKENWWAKDNRYNQGRFNVNKVILKVIRDPNIAYKHFEKGNIDSYTLVLPEFWHNKAKGKLFDNGYIEKIVFYNDKPRSSSGLFLNQDNEILKDKNIRVALAHSLNFGRVIKTVLRGDYERLQKFHTGYGDYSSDTIKVRSFDLDKANKILDVNGWGTRGGDGIRTKDGQRLSLNLTYGHKEHNDRWSILKQDAIKAGIELNLKLQDPSSHYKTIMQKQHQITSLGWSTGFRPAFWEHFHSENAHKPQTNNITNTDNKVMDDLIIQYRSETNEEKRITLSKKIANIIHESAAFIPDFNVPYTRGAHWRWLKFPAVPGSKTTGNLYSPFGDGGIFWIDSEQKIETKSSRKSSTKYPVVNKIYDQYKVNS